MPHRAVLVSVKAPVDAGIAGIVETLNRFPGVWTVNSCEGNGTAPAFVDFRFGERPHEAADFLVWLARQLPSDVAKVTGEWGGGESLSLTLSTPKANLDQLASILQEILRNGHNSPFACGKARTGSRSSERSRSRPPKRT